MKALFVYNCNAAAVAPDSNQVLTGLRRPDLFTVVHEQFFTDTTDYADIVLPATTFLEHKEVMGAYGHTMAQLSERAIQPPGEARSNVWLFSELGQRIGFTEQAFRDGEDELIAQALDNPHPHFDGITTATLSAHKQLPLALPQNSRGEALPFSDPSWFRTANSKANLLPLPEWHAAQESRSGAAAAEELRARLADTATSLGDKARFPLEFIPRKADNYMNSTFANLPRHQIMERRTAGILEMHPTDAEPRSIRSGDAVEVFNTRGRIELVARVGQSITPGAVAARLDWQKLSPENQNVNALTSQRLTDIGGGATFYSNLVEVARVHPFTAD